MIEGNFTRIAAPAESIHNDLLYSSYLEIIEVELCGGPNCNYCGWWLTKLVVQKEEFFGFIEF